MNRMRALVAGAIAAAAIAAVAPAEAETLRLLTWGGYAPDAVIKQFKAETGIDVEVTISNNEDIISKLRATGGAGFDLVQPSQDRIIGPQTEYGIYKPLDLSKIDASLFIPELLEASKKNTTVDGKVYGVAHLWGSSGMVVDRSKAGDIKSFADLCKPEYKGKVSMRLKRPALLAMAFALGDDPFAAYGDKAKYKAIIERAAAKLAECKANVKAYWSGSDDLINMLRSGEVVASEAWDFDRLQAQHREPEHQLRGAQQRRARLDRHLRPAGQDQERGSRLQMDQLRDEAGGRRADHRGLGQLLGLEGLGRPGLPGLRKAYKDAFTPEVIASVKWFPAVPAGLEDMEGKCWTK